MLTILWYLIPAVLLVIFLRWAFFARLKFYHAPFCPGCGESRGRWIGVGERTGHAYFRCPHCGNVFEAPEKP